MQTLTLTPDQVNKLRPGDRIVALNGTRLRNGGHTVIAPLKTLPNSTVQAVALRTPSGTHANLYPDTHVHHSVTVERETPAARPVTRTLNGVRLTCIDGSWWTPDRRYQISFGFGGVTECEADHPVRITPALVASAAKERGTSWAEPVLEAVREGRSGYMCPAGSEHTYDEWQVWDHARGDYALNGNLQHGDSWREVADELTAAIAAGTD